MSEREAQQPSYIPTEGLTVEQDQQLAFLLSLWGGGRISTPVFTELARMIPQPIVEVVVLRFRENRTEVLLIPRPDDDIVWRGMQHTPGSAMRAADYERKMPIDGTFERVRREINSEFAYQPVFAGIIYRQSERGPEVKQVFFAQVAETSDSGDQIWCPVDQLAQNPKFIQSQLDHVNMAAEAFRRLRG